MSAWFSLPYEIQQLIVVDLVTSHGIRNLYNLLLVSKSFHDSLVGAPSRGIPQDDSLYFLLFRAMYDDEAVKRRLRIQLDANTYASVFKYRSQLLRHIGQFNAFSQTFFTPDTLLRGLWEIYLMLLDDDGKNMQRLQAVPVKQFLLEQVLTRIENDIDEHGWPRETTHLQLAAASFAIMSDRADVLNEHPELTERIYNDLEQIYVASHRYPHTQLPVTIFHQYHLSNIPRLQPGSLPTIATLPFFPPSEFTYFGHELLIAPPPLACSATLILTNRRESRPLVVLPDRPIPPVIQEMNAFRAAALGTEVPHARSGREHLSALPRLPVGSSRWDHTFTRMRAVAHILTGNSSISTNTWFRTMYSRQMFSGKWLGRILLPDVRFMVQMTNMHPASFTQVRQSLHEDLQHMSVWNLYFHADLREHISRDEHVGCGLAQVDAGYRNGYFPDDVDPISGRNFSENNGEVSVIDPNEPDREYQTKRYVTSTEDRSSEHFHSHSPSTPFSAEPSSISSLSLSYGDESVNMEIYDDDHVPIPDEVESEFAQEGVGINVGAFDVIITGETDAMHSAAWGDYRFYGRVRKLDGLIVLVRASPSDPDQGRWVFAGNMHLANTIVGLCRQSQTDIGTTSLQGPFIISKVGQEFYHPQHNLS